MNPLPRILFLHPGGRPRPGDWSGVPFFLASALEKLTGVDYFDFASPACAPRVASLQPMRLWRRANHFWAPWRSHAAARATARQVGALPLEEPTVCFAAYSMPIAYLPRQLRTAFFHDAVMDQFLSLYGLQRRFSRIDRWADRRLEQRCIERADDIFYSSRWAQEEAMRRLAPGQRSKVHVVLIGGNLPDPSGVPAPRLPQPRFLFIGNDWERKGGAVALALYERLKVRFPAARMSLVGKALGVKRPPAGCEIVGAMDKSDPRHVERVAELYEQSDFLLLPTRADCSSCVCAEAQLRGCLPIVTRVGGVPELVRHDETGFVFAMEDYPSAACRAIADLCEDVARFQRMRAEAHRHAWRHLRWDVIAARILSTLAIPPRACDSGT